MAGIFWGVVPEENISKEGKGKTVAAYTGVEDVVEVEGQEEKSQPGPQTQSEDQAQPGPQTQSEDQAQPETQPQSVPSPEAVNGFSEMIGRINKKLDERKAAEAAEMRRLAEEKAKQKPASTPKVAQNTAKPKGRTTPKHASTVISGSSSHRDSARQPTKIIAGDSPVVTMALLFATGGAAAPKLEEKPKTTATAPIKFPLAKEQQKVEELSRQTGMKSEEVRKILAPGWTIAEVLNPLCYVQRARLNLRWFTYDVEYAITKAKDAIHDVLHKKRPLSAKS